ncbi:hypothetical protein L9F63_020063, partial [Diploptera punctata]
CILMGVVRLRLPPFSVHRLGTNLLYFHFTLFYILFSHFLNYELYFRVVFLIFSVSEGALGLSILISVTRPNPE